MLMGRAAFASEKICAFKGGPEKLKLIKVNCSVVTVKITFKWYNNVVATKNAD